MSATSTKKRVKRQHVALPKFCLRYFAVDEKVWVVDFHLDVAPYCTNIINALCISDFYTVATEENERDDRLEINFSRVEGEAKPILDRLLKEMVIPEGGDKEKLAGFLACLWLRGPRERQLQLEFYESTAKHVDRFYWSDPARFDEFWRQFKAKNPDSTITKELARKRADERIVEGFLTPEAYVQRFLRALPTQERLFRNMSFSVLWADPLSMPRFITGDFPFVVEDKCSGECGIPTNGGLLNRNVIIYVPVTPLVCLVLEHGGQPGIYPVPSGNLIPILNFKLALAASRYVVSSSERICWFKKKRIHTSADELHRELYPRKLQEPLIRDAASPDETVVARRSWNKLRGDKRIEDERHEHG